MLVCSKCKGVSVQVLAWVDANKGVYISEAINTIEDKWCADCEEHVNFEEVEDEEL